MINKQKDKQNKTNKQKSVPLGKTLEIFPLDQHKETGSEGAWLHLTLAVELSNV